MQSSIQNHKIIYSIQRFVIFTFPIALIHWDLSKGIELEALVPSWLIENILCILWIVCLLSAICCHHSYCHFWENASMDALVTELIKECKPKKLWPVNYHQVSAGLMIIEINRWMQNARSTIIAIRHSFVQCKIGFLWLNYSALSTCSKNELMNELKDRFTEKHLSILKQLL